jgi:hypothetical protein
VEGQGLETSLVVLEAANLPLVPVSPGFAPFDSLNSADELVYPVPDSAHVLLILNAKLIRAHFYLMDTF